MYYNYIYVLVPVMMWIHISVTCAGFLYNDYIDGVWQFKVLQAACMYNSCIQFYIKQPSLHGVLSPIKLLPAWAQYLRPGTVFAPWHNMAAGRKSDYSIYKQLCTACTYACTTWVVCKLLLDVPESPPPPSRHGHNIYSRKATIMVAQCILIDYIIYINFVACQE